MPPSWIRIEQLQLTSVDYPYDTIKEAQDWWKSVDLPEEQKQAIARENAIKLLKLPLKL